MTDLRLVDDLVKRMDESLAEPPFEYGREQDAFADYFQALSLWEKYMGTGIGFLLTEVLAELDKTYADLDTEEIRINAFRAIHRSKNRG